jgi:hypothetical protein
MTQSEKIELIKAAAMLTQAMAGNATSKYFNDVTKTFDYFYNHLLKKILNQ